MTKIQFGAFINDASGKLNGHVISKNRAGSIMRGKVSPSQPVSNYSAVQRSKFTAISQTWKTLSAAAVSSWNAAAKLVKRMGFGGNSYIPSGFQYFAELNNNLAAIGVAPITTVPADAIVPTMTSASVAMAAGAGTAILTYAPAVPATVKFAVYATPGLSVGVQPKASDFRLIGKIATADSSPFTATTMYTDKFGTIPVAGKVVYWRLRPIHATAGFGGRPFGCSCTVSA
jgi:hypothetical protein